jgi:glycosyltransferase involved in cell wall biosynthesis
VPLVSVIIPTRCRHDLLARALASVLAQTHRELEVVVVDDNDPDDRVSAEAVLQPLLADPRIRVVTGTGGRSAAAARNRGLAAALGEWVTYLDDDDEYHPEKVARQLALALSSGSPLVLCGFAYALGPRRREKQVSAAAFEGDGLLVGATWGTPFLFHRRDPAARFDEQLRAGEDTLFAFALLQRLGLARVPNVALPLVIVHQQAERVNHGHRAHWRADCLVLYRTRRLFSRAARGHYLARARLAAAKHGSPVGGGICAASAGVLRTGGLREWRAVANAMLFRSGWFRRWLVS